MKKLTKRVKADGLWFDVPIGTVWLVASYDGILIASGQKFRPVPNRTAWSFVRPHLAAVCSVKLEGADWRECCWYVGDQVDGEAESQPVAWMAIYHGEVHDNAIGLTQAAVVSQTERFGWEPSLTEIIPLYRNPPPEQMQRREWMARGVEAAFEFADNNYAMPSIKLGVIREYADKIRAGEVDL